MPAVLVGDGLVPSPGLVPSRRPPRPVPSSRRQRPRVLDLAQAEARLDMPDSGVLEDFLHDQFREMIDVPGEHLHDVVVAAAHGVAFDDMRLRCDPRVEVVRTRVGLLVHVDQHERGDRESKRPRLDYRRVPGDDPVPLEFLHPSKTRRFRQPDLLRQLDVRHPAVVLQQCQDATFDSIQCHEQKPPQLLPNREHYALISTNKGKKGQIFPS